MNPENCEGTLTAPLRNALNSIQCIRDQIRDGELGEEGGSFSLSMMMFFHTFKQRMEALSSDVAKFGLVFSKPPEAFLQDGEKLVESVSTSIKALRETYYRIRESQDGESGDHGEAFDLSMIWETFKERKEALSSDVAALCLVFSRPPEASLQDVEKLVESVLNTILILREAYNHIRESQGVTLRQQVREAIVEVLDGVLQLLEVILTSPPQSLTPELIKSTKEGWFACVRFARLPKDNKEALLVVLSSQSLVIYHGILKMYKVSHKPEDPFKDCLINDPDDNSDQERPRNNNHKPLSEKDQQVVRACVEVSETAAVCLRKLRSAIEANGDRAEPQKVAQLDDLAHTIREISSSVEDLALNLYHPIDYSIVENHTSKLAVLLRKLLDLIRSSHVCGEAELTWVQFLEAAVDHNVKKVKELVELDG